MLQSASLTSRYEDGHDVLGCQCPVLLFSCKSLLVILADITSSNIKHRRHSVRLNIWIQFNKYFVVKSLHVD